MNEATKIAVYMSNPIDTELIRLFEQRQCISNRDVFCAQSPDSETDADRLDNAIEMAQILRDHCIEKAITLCQADVRFRIGRAVEALQNDMAAPSVCYENALNTLLRGLDNASYTRAS